MAAVTSPRGSRLPIWAVIAAGGMITAISLGVRSTFGLFLDPVIESLDTDRGTFALAVAIQQVVWGLSQPIAGAISDRYGAARTLAGGTVLYFVAMVMMSTAQSTGMLLLSAGFLTGLSVGAASFAVVLSAVGRMVEPERRSMALGIVNRHGVGRSVPARADQPSKLIDANGMGVGTAVAPRRESIARRGACSHRRCSRPGVGPRPAE